MGISKRELNYIKMRAAKTKDAIPPKTIKDDEGRLLYVKTFLDSNGELIVTKSRVAPPVTPPRRTINDKINGFINTIERLVDAILKDSPSEKIELLALQIEHHQEKMFKIFTKTNPETQTLDVSEYGEQLENLFNEVICKISNKYNEPVKDTLLSLLNIERFQTHNHDAFRTVSNLYLNELEKDAPATY